MVSVIVLLYPNPRCIHFFQAQFALVFAFCAFLEWVFSKTCALLNTHGNFLNGHATPVPWYVRVLPISWSSEGAAWLSLLYWCAAVLCPWILQTQFPWQGKPRPSWEMRHIRLQPGVGLQDPCSRTLGRAKARRGVTDTQNVRTDCSKFPGFLWSRWELAWVRYTWKWNRSVRFWPVRTWVSIENASLLKS